MHKRLVDLRLFRRWLYEEQDDNDIVGLACRHGSCPIARYIRWTYNTRIVDVSPNFIDADLYEDGLRMTYTQRTVPWMRKFIHAVDERGAGIPILAVEAREILSNL